MAVCRTHEAPGSETKDFSIDGAAGSMSIGFTSGPWRVVQGVHLDAMHTGGLCCSRGTLTLGNPPLL